MDSIFDGFVESRGVNIHYIAAHTAKGKKPSLLFVPGIMMPAWIWDKQIEYFSKNFQVAAMEPRSQGLSDQASDGHYAYSLAEDIKAVVDKLKLEPLVLIGWSIGVPQVINYAARFASKNLLGLVLIDGIVGADHNEPFYQSMIQYWSQFQTDREANTRAFIKSIFKQQKPDSFLEKLIETAKNTPTNTAMTLIYNYILQDFRPLLPTIQTPTLIATIDGPRLNYMTEMQKMLPCAEMKLFQSAGHALFADQPDQFNQILEQFINRLFRDKRD